MVGDVPLVLVTNPKLKLDSLDALIANARPGRARSVRAQRAGIAGAPADRTVPIAYRRRHQHDSLQGIGARGGGPAGRRRPTSNMPAVLEHIRSGSLRALAILSSGSLDAFPGRTHHGGAGISRIRRLALVRRHGSQGTDPKIIVLLNRHISEALQSKAVVRAFAAQAPRRSSPRRIRPAASSQTRSALGPASCAKPAPNWK